MGVGRAEISGR